MLVRFLPRDEVPMRPRWFLIGLALIGLAFPGSAVAQETLTTGRVATQRGFQLSLFAIRASGGDSSLLTASLARRSGSGSGSSDEVDRYDFNRGIAFTGSSDLRWARVRGVLLRGRGSIRVAFHATGRARPVPLPKGCTGSPGKKRRGVVRGSFVLKADRLGTIRVKVIAATLKIPPVISECTGGGGPGSHGTTLMANGSVDGHALYVFATEPRSRGLVREGVSVARVGAGFSFSHSLTVLAPRTAYTFSDDLARGKLRGVGDLRGNATYLGSRASGGASQGLLRGNLAAGFAAIGTVRPFAHGPVSADQFRY